MSIQIITSAWLNFQKIPKEDFTSKMIEGMAMTRLINDFDKKDYARLEWLRDHTHKDINRPIYELDRYVDETKGKISNKHFTFDGETYSQDLIQYYLCLAIEEVHEIIYKNFKDFKVEEKTNIDDDEEESGYTW